VSPAESGLSSYNAFSAHIAEWYYMSTPL
jgi:hypothetical protein